MCEEHGAVHKLSPRGVGLRGESCSVLHAYGERVVYTHRGRAPMPSVLGASPNLSSRHSYELYPAQLELSPAGWLMACQSLVYHLVLHCSLAGSLDR